MTTAITPTIDELIACKPEAWDVPFFNKHSCRIYVDWNTVGSWATSQDILECMIGEFLGLDSHSITVSPTNDLSVMNGTIQQIVSSLVGTVLTIGQNFIFDLWLLLHTNYFITDWQNNYEIKNHEQLRWRGVDWMHFNVWPSGIEIGLPTPVAQYFTPGRCNCPDTWLHATRTWQTAGMTTDVTIDANMWWVAWNEDFVFNGTTTIAAMIGVWNLAHPTNTYTITGDGTQIPDAWVHIFVTWWTDATPCPTQAYFAWTVAGLATAITIEADIAWSAGNVVLLCNWTDTVQEIIDAWNLANPTNTLTLQWGDGTQVPLTGEYIALHHGYDSIICQDWTYMPNNKRLVLTWDCVTNSSQWIPPQCCLQEMKFDWENIVLTSGSKDNTFVHCWTCMNSHEWSGGWGSCSCPNPEPLPSINTDNQQLSLTDDCPNSQMLCLTRRHGGTLGIQIPDPDSCVDLININEQTRDLQGNLLYLLGSDGLINDVVDLSQADRHTLNLFWNTLEIFDSTWTINNFVHLTNVNEQTLDLQWNILYILWSDGMPNSSIDLSQADQQTLLLTGNVLEILNSNGWVTNHVDLDTVAKEILTIADRNLCVMKGITPPNGCITCINQCIDLSRINYTCEEVTDCVCNYEVDRVAEWVPATLAVGTEALLQTAWTDFFAVPRSICSMNIFMASFLLYLEKINIELGNLVSRQKYWAKIMLSDNYVMWSQHTAYSGNHNDPRNQRWFIPAFNKSQGRHAQNSSMISTIDYWPGGPFEHHNEISPDSGSLWTLSIADIGYSTNFGTFYDQTPSTNNPNANIDSHFCKDYARTITIVMTWRYHVSLQWVLQADHNVQAFRYCCLRYNNDILSPNYHKLDLLIDSKFGWWHSVGSSSLNSPLVPRTNEYDCGGTKVVLLYAWDILFPAVKISPQTIWGNHTWWPWITKDILHELNDLTNHFPPPGGSPTPYFVPYYGTHTPWIHTPGTASWTYVSRSPWTWINWHITWNHVCTLVPQDQIEWPTANLPNVSPHFFSPHWWVDGAENYGYNLVYPGGFRFIDVDTIPERDNYWYDDWVVTLYGKASWFNSDGTGWTEWGSEWASLSVHRVQAPQRDEVDRTP